MSNELDDRELDALIASLASTEEERAALLEEHRQLEKDLLRLSDPLPPADFVGQVMKKVAASPARVSKVEVVTAGIIVFVTVALAAVTLAATGGFAGSFGLALAQLVVYVREALVAVGSGLLALWTTAALPAVVALSMLLAASLVALKRSLRPANVKVTS
ncbi:MAG: hypothetical protein AMXMBFR34_14880 [Myxococcaceae bacterium]